MFLRGIVARPSTSRLVAFCEPNAVRAQYYNDLFVNELGGSAPVPVYRPDDFDAMVKKERLETVVITCVDSLHDIYIVKALKAGRKLLYTYYDLYFAKSCDSQCADGEANDDGRRQVSPHT